MIPSTQALETLKREILRDQREWDSHGREIKAREMALDKNKALIQKEEGDINKEEMIINREKDKLQKEETVLQHKRDELQKEETEIRNLKLASDEIRRRLTQHEEELIKVQQELSQALAKDKTKHKI